MPKRKLQERYFDTPDGHEYLKKLYCIMRPTLDLAMACGVSDILVLSRPIGFVPIVVRFCQIVSRPLAIAFIFPTTVYISTKLRQKDDGWNWAFGAVLCGFYANRFIKNPLLTSGLTFGIAAALATVKVQRMGYGGTFHYSMYKIHEEKDYGLYSRYFDWSWRKTYPRTWLTPEEAAAKGIE